MDDPASISTLTPPVKGAYEYWKTLPNHKGLPLKSALEPLAMPTDILPHVFLVELSYTPFSALIRLQGTYLNFSLGQHFTGKYIDESTFGESAADILKNYEKTAQNRVAYVSKEEVYSSSNRTMLIEAIHLPLIDEDGEVKYIFGALSRISGTADPEKEFEGSRWEVLTRDKI